MTRYTATIRVDLVAETTEARDFLLATIARECNNPHRMAFVKDRSGHQTAARILRGSLSRVRKAAKRKRA